MLKILHVVGARPNFMKAAPVVHAMAAYPDSFSQLLVHTGQHYDANMSDVFFRQLDMPRPDVNLNVGPGSHAAQTAEIMRRFEPVLLEYRPDWVFVPGDVNSTLACALVAAKLGAPVAHIEAGLRSFDWSMPEEVNRVLTDRVSDLLFTPSRDANENLRAEGIPDARIRFVGNLMIDTLVRLRPRAQALWPALRDRLHLDRFGLVTLHRPSNVDDPAGLRELVAAFEDLAGEIPILFPLHPRTAARLRELGLSLDGSGVVAVPPLGYLEFLALQSHAAFVLTDSGGIQEETTYLGTPCLTLRENTERPVTITHGTNRLVSRRRTAIREAALEAIAQPRRVPAPELWDGESAARVVRQMLATSRSAASAA